MPSAGRRLYRRGTKKHGGSRWLFAWDFYAHGRCHWIARGPHFGERNDGFFFSFFVVSARQHTTGGGRRAMPFVFRFGHWRLQAMVHWSRRPFVPFAFHFFFGLRIESPDGFHPAFMGTHRTPNGSAWIRMGGVSLLFAFFFFLTYSCTCSMTSLRMHMPR